MATAYEAYVFDLDGTLLNTLPDLVFLTNMVLEEHGMPQRTTEEINSFVGAGARVLLQRAATAGTPDAEIDAMLARWKQLYPEFGHKHTVPYEGISDVLAQLKDGGAKLGVLSNKFDAAVQEVIARHFPGVFHIVRGESPETPRKPDPTGLLRMIDELGVLPSRSAYVGDSGSDMTVALRAGAVPLGVTWGYRDADELRKAGAQALANQAADLLRL